jgi:membrane-bound lytic murein transglycosylase A
LNFIFIFLILFFGGCSHRFENNYYDSPYIFGDSSDSDTDYSSFLKKRFPDVYPRKIHKKGKIELVEVFYDEIKGWKQDKKINSLKAFVRGCEKKSSINRKNICQEAKKLYNSKPKNYEITAFFQQYFTPFIVYNRYKMDDKGIVTGYYIPLIKGSRIKTSKFKYPIYAKPRDFKVPYYTHKEIDNQNIDADVICWVENRVDRFFLHIQGSGTIKLESGKIIGVGYTAQNGYEYSSIGDYMIKHFGMKKHKLSLKFIKQWLKKNPDKADEVLHSNKSFVFFIEQKSNRAIGAMGVNLIPESTIAIDTTYIPLGAPIFIRTKDPETRKSLNHLFMAQDKGGAIKGVIRADLFFGFGDKAGKRAGNMKNKGEFYILLPYNYKLQ